jgi:hypothetical protein
VVEEHPTTPALAIFIYLFIYPSFLPSFWEWVWGHPFTLGLSLSPQYMNTFTLRLSLSPQYLDPFTPVGTLCISKHVHFESFFATLLIFFAFPFAIRKGVEFFVGLGFNVLCNLY